MNAPKYIFMVLVILAVSVIPSQIASGSDAGQDTVPRFEYAVCAIPIPEAEKEHVRCGYLVVPENRSRKDSRLIRLPYRAESSLPQCTPAEIYHKKTG